MTASSLVSMTGRTQKLPTIDEEHLGRMTLGDTSLEREVLEIFVRQATLTLKRITGAEPASAAAAAHTLKGSAKGIGAWRVAEAAERLEQVAAGGAAGDAMNAAIMELEAASLETCAAIGARLERDLDSPAAGAPAVRSHDN